MSQANYPYFNSWTGEPEMVCFRGGQLVRSPIGGLFTNVRIRGLASVSIGTTSVLAPVTIGNRGVNNSVDAQIVVSRNVTGTSGNAHAFSDSSNISRSGNIGYNSYDARTNFTGTAGFDHYTGFQFAPDYASSGTMGEMNAFFAGGTVSAGTITDNKPFWVADLTGAGTVVNNYGLFVEQLTKGTTANWAVYTEGTTASRFNGSVIVGPGADATTVPGAALYVTNNGTTAVAVRNSTGNCETYWGVAASSGFIGTLTNHSFAIFTNDTNRFTVGTAVTISTLPIRFPSFTVAGVPSAATAGAGAMIYVSNETGGAVPAFSDGTNWRRVTDRAIIA